MKNIIKYPKYYATEDGLIYSSLRNRYLKPIINKHGYPVVCITISKRKTKTIKVHRLIAETFLANPYNKTDVNHIDGNKSNNNISNLEWVSRSENMKHAYKLGLAKITQAQRDKIKLLGKLQIGKNNPAARKLINIETGEIFHTIKDVLSILNIKRSTFQAMLSNQNPNKTPYRYFIK